MSLNASNQASVVDLEDARSHPGKDRLSEVFEQRQKPATPLSSCTPKELSAMDTILYWPTVKTTSMSCWVV